VLLVTIGVASAVYLEQDLASSGANLTAAVLSVANMKDMLQGNYFAVSADAQPFLHYWSLSVEEQFYLFFPLGFWLLFLKARRHTLTILGVLCGFSLVSCIWLTRANPVWGFFPAADARMGVIRRCIVSHSERTTGAGEQQ
jgi:peptidoglycan/LPS O-acetylase OafA/YrhL